MTSTAILFAKTTLYMPPSSLILIGVITPSSGILGSLAWPYLQRRFSYSNLKMLIILVIMASMIPAYGCLGFLPILHRAHFGGLTTPGEMYVLAVYFGKSSLFVQVFGTTDIAQGPYMAPSRVTLEHFMPS